MPETTTPEFKPSVDPVTFEVVRHALWQINDEQGRTIINVSGSPIASEVNDFNVALTTPGGDLVMIGPYLLHQTGAISVVIQKAIELLGDDVRPGDLYLTNDPWMGALHHNDVCCVAPIHVDGELVAWSACTIHQVDVGGPTPGSWSMDAWTTFEEAPRYRFVKVLREGEVQNEVVATYLTNSRTPELLELDLRAMIASSNVVKERLLALFAKYGQPVVSAVMEDCIEYSAALLRRRLRQIPDGEWYSEDYMDHDGHREKLYAIRVRLRKEGDHLEFDYRDTDAEADGFINCTYAGCLAGTLSPIMTQLCPDIPWNEGLMRCITMLTKEGLVNNARFPAPTGMGTVSGCHHTSNAAMGAVARMLTSAEELLPRLMANWSGSAYVYNIFGRNQYGRDFGTMLVDSHLGGAGARFIGDGYDTAGTLSVPRPSVPNIETLESLYPLLYLYRRRTVDSGGPGRNRGGVSGETAMTVYGADELSVHVSTQGGDQSGAIGVAGGYPGGGANAILIEGSDVISLLRAGKLPEAPDEFGGQLHVLPPKDKFDLKPGEVFITVPHGGGGLGDPLLRDPEAVRTDVIEGYVSREQARSTYGVVFAEDGVTGDPEGTQRQRMHVRRDRLRAAGLTDPAPSLDGTRELPGTRVNEALNVHEGRLHCRQCHAELGPVADGLRNTAAWAVQEMGRAGPWVSRRFDGRSNYFNLVEIICPGCGGLLDVYMWRKEGSREWQEPGYDVGQLAQSSVQEAESR